MRRTHPVLFVCIIAAFVAALAVSCGPETEVTGGNGDGGSENGSSENGDPENGDPENGGSGNVDPEDIEIDFVLQNDASESVYIQESSVRPSPWISVESDDGRVRLDRTCLDPCDCEDDIDPMECPICEVEDTRTARELEPGEQRRVSWDGSGYLLTEEHCLEEITPTGQSLEVELCYDFDFNERDDGQQQVDDSYCHTEEFELGVDGEVVVIVTEEGD